MDDIKGIAVTSPVNEVDGESVKHLQKWLKKIYTIEVPLVEAAELPDKLDGLILLGPKLALESGLITKQELDAVTPGGHVIKCGDGKTVIAGPDSWSTLYGVVAFLEQLGVKFYLGYPFDHLNPVPKPETREIGPFTISDKPVFPFRSAYEVTFKETFKQVAEPRKGANPEIFTKELGSDLWYDHTSGYLVPKLLYYDEHPEYYAMLKNGKRIAKDAFSDARTYLCLSNPGVTRISIERMLPWIENQIEKRYFFLTYGDGVLYCQCAPCLKLDEGEEPSKGRYGNTHYAKRHLHWVNPVARAVAEKYPDKILFTFAYAGSDRPPKQAHVEKNVWVIASTGLGGIRFWDHGMSPPGAQEKFFGKINGWLRIVPDRLLVCEYHAYIYKPAMFDCMAARLRTYAKKGLRGIVFTYGVPTNFQPLWKYVFARMKWNPERDPYKLAREFIDFYYGPAAEHIADFFRLSHERYVQTLKDGVTTDSPWRHIPDYYEPAFVDGLMTCFAKAADAAKEKPVLKKEILTEEGIFLDDVVKHMPSYELTDEVKQRFRLYLSRYRDIAKETKTEKKFVADARHLAADLEKEQKGYTQLIEAWLKEWFWWLNPPEPGKGPATDDEDDEGLEDLE